MWGTPEISLKLPVNILQPQILSFFQRHSTEDVRQISGAIVSTLFGEKRGLLF